MNTIITAEIVSAVFLSILLMTQMAERFRSKSSRYLNVCVLLVLVTLVIDAMAYIFMDDATPFVFRYLVCLIAYLGEGICFLSFAFYSEAFFAERTELNPWVFRILKIAELIWIVLTAVTFISGKMVIFENGVEVADNGYPLYLMIYQIAFMLYTPAVGFRYRKLLGSDAVVLLSFFNIAPIIGILVAMVAYYDYSYVLGAVALFFITELPQRKRMQAQQAERAAHEALKGNYERIFALEDDFEVLYDIELATGRYDIFVKGQTFGDVNNNLINNNSFFDDVEKNLNVVYPEDRQGNYDATRPEFIRKALAEDDHFDRYYRLLVDGNPAWARMRIVYKDAGKKNIIIGVFNAENDIRAKQLEEALSMADAASRAKTDFLFNMSHDIRTPMNAIIGFTNIAKKEIRNPEKALDSLEKVQLSSDILLNLINDVLDMSRIESGKASLHEEKHEILAVFDSFEPTMANLAASKDIDLKFTIGEVRDRFVFADGPRFDRVLINIISNAIKYTPPEGFVKVSVEQIEDTRPGYGNYRFVIADSGIGMSEEFQKHMFEDFAREENSTTSGVQGTGLGLSLAKKLIEMMGGTISCVSRQGVGTTFTIVFPFRLQSEADIAEERAAAQENVEIDLRGKRTLLVEDNELNREIAEEILTDEGIIVETAVDGQKAVNKVRERGTDYYDFILMDIQMPVMNGYEATKTIHELLPEFRTPIIALSANAFAEDRKRSLEAGMDAHVAKPIDIKELLTVLTKFL